jgi:hypothetical protein
MVSNDDIIKYKFGLNGREYIVESVDDYVVTLSADAIKRNVSISNQKKYSSAYNSKSKHRRVY